MNKLYVNFNFFRARCPFCNLSGKIDLRDLAEEIIQEYTISHANLISKYFQCFDCKKKYKVNLCIERVNNILIIE